MANVESMEKEIELLKVQSAVQTTILQAIDARLKGLEDTLKWINRTIVGVIIVAVLALIIKP